VVLAAAGLEEAKRVDALCHAEGVKFIWAQSRGVFASVFNDFGPEFTVFDVDGASGQQPVSLEVSPRPAQHEGLNSSSHSLAYTGEDPHTAIVASIGNSNPAVVTCVEDERLQFQVCAFLSHLIGEPHDDLYHLHGAKHAVCVYLYAFRRTESL
jgi:ubiquitin-activating enzyme E1